MTRFSLMVCLVVFVQFCYCATSMAQEVSQRDMSERFIAFQQSQKANLLAIPFSVNSSSEGQRYETEVLTVYEGMNFNDLSKLLKQKQYWCELVFLHPNLKTCVYNEKTNQLIVYVGRKRYQQPKRAYKVTFDFSTQSSDGLMSMSLSADTGPFGSKNYKTVFQAIPVANGVFGRWYFDLDMGYAGLAIDVYYKTLGRSKVGFTQLNGSDEEKPKYVKGLQGAIERNFMRYYLAMKVYLITWEKPLGERFEARINAWFDESESFSRQLRDQTRSQYLANKRREIINQKAEQESLNRTIGDTF